MEYYVIVEKLKKEFLEYYEFLKEKYDYFDDIDSLDNELEYDDYEDEDIEENDEMFSDLFDYEEEEKILNNISKDLFDYISLKKVHDYNVVYNKDLETSKMLKLNIVSSIYEFYCNNYSFLLEEEKKLYKYIKNNLNINSVLNLFEGYGIEMLKDYISYYYDIEMYNDINKHKTIKKKNIKNLIKINPYIIFDYRFMYGIKLEKEDIPSIKVGNEILSTVNSFCQGDINLDNIDQLLTSNPDFESYISDIDMFKYMVANIYENILNKKKITDSEKKFLKYIENVEIQDLAMLYFSTPDSHLEMLLHFSLLNKDNLKEEKIYKLHQNVYNKHKLKVMKKLYPYYYEDLSYFSKKYNKKNQI